MKSDLSLSKRCWCCAIGEGGEGWPLWHVPSRACPLMSCNDVVLNWVAVHAACPVSVFVFVLRCCLCLSCDDVMLSWVAVHAACPELHAICCYQLAT